MKIADVLKAIEQDSSIVVKLLPVATQAYALYGQYQAAKSDEAKLGVIGQGLTLAGKQGITLDELGTLASSVAATGTAV